MRGRESPGHTFERQSIPYMSVICYILTVIQVYKSTRSYLFKGDKGYGNEKQTDQEHQTMVMERPPFCKEWFALIRFFSDYFSLGFAL